MLERLDLYNIFHSYSCFTDVCGQVVSHFIRKVIQVLMFTFIPLTFACISILVWTRNEKRRP